MVLDKNSWLVKWYFKITKYDQEYHTNTNMCKFISVCFITGPIVYFVDNFLPWVIIGSFFVCSSFLGSNWYEGPIFLICAMFLSFLSVILLYTMLFFIPGKLFGTKNKPSILRTYLKDLKNKTCSIIEFK